MSLFAPGFTSQSLRLDHVRQLNKTVLRPPEAAPDTTKWTADLDHYETERFFRDVHSVCNWKVHQKRLFELVENVPPSPLPPLNLLMRNPARDRSKLEWADKRVCTGHGNYVVGAERDPASAQRKHKPSLQCGCKASFTISKYYGQYWYRVVYNFEHSGHDPSSLAEIARMRPPPLANPDPALKLQQASALLDQTIDKLSASLATAQTLKASDNDLARSNLDVLTSALASASSTCTSLSTATLHPDAPQLR